jgi:AraC-like DNA-binding protein
LAAVLESADSDGMLLSARAGNAYCLRSIRTSAVFLSVVLKGHKRIHHGGEVFDTVPGNMAVIAGGCCIDVENIPDPRSGEYLAALIVVPEAVLNVTRALLGGQAEGGAPSFAPEPEYSTYTTSPCSVVPLGLVGAELEHCIENAAVCARPRFHHALAGLLLRLHESGISVFLRPTRPRLADHVSSLLATEPARAWRSVDIEDRLAMSGATLRRQLAAEQTSLRQLLIEARLGQALQMLQSTRLPVKAVAARSGYRSVSSFVRRFHERYGVEPSRVANAN